MAKKIFSTFQATAFTHAMVEAIQTLDDEAFSELLSNAKADCPRPASRIDPHFIMLLDIGANKLLNAASAQLILRALSAAAVSDLTKLAAMLITGNHLPEGSFDEWFGESGTLKHNPALVAEEMQKQGQPDLALAFQYGAVRKQDPHILKAKLEAVCASTQDAGVIKRISEEIVRYHLTPVAFLTTLKVIPDAYKSLVGCYVDQKHLNSKYLPELLAEGIKPRSRMLLQSIDYAFRSSDKKSFGMLLDLAAEDSFMGTMLDAEMCLNRPRRAPTPDQSDMLETFDTAFNNYAKRIFENMDYGHNLALPAEILLITYQKNDESTFKKLLSATAGKNIPELAVVLNDVFNQILFAEIPGVYRDSITPAGKAMLKDIKECADRLVGEQLQKIMELPEKTTPEPLGRRQRHQIRHPIHGIHATPGMMLD
jgi:hypothetical protein